MARALQVLMVDDDANDIFCVTRATKSSGTDCTLLSAASGAEAMRILQGRGTIEALPLPDLLLLDLKMPGINGFDFLNWLRNDHRLQVIPAIILSGSILQEDVRKAYRLGAKGYIVKPVEYQDLEKKLRALYNFWSHAHFPSSCARGTVIG